jgi:hypothetical protein
VDHFYTIPWVVAITVRAKFGEKDSECYAETVANCTGAIVGPRTILSTSHCFLLPDICKAGKTVLVPLATIRVTILRGHPNSTAFNVVNITLPGCDLHKLEEDTPPPPPIVSHDLAVLTVVIIYHSCFDNMDELETNIKFGSLHLLACLAQQPPSTWEARTPNMYQP